MIAAGQSIGNYRILSKIGTGGMGAVYLAEHPLIGKRVALKVIHRELSGNRDVVQRFFQEARAVNQIGNEHIVEIHDFGVSPDNDHFYIMEYLEGHTLASIMAKETTLVVMRALHVGAQIANALSAAHVAGVIHRDLKPDNIMLMLRMGDPDFVKVLDFGLAKVFAEGGSAVKTAAGVLLGTPQYMSPEACESKRDIDHRTDIYALGILLFQMMTGKLPFDGESMGEVLVKQVTALPPAPRGLNPMIPPSVEQILLRCLAKPVDARFQTMQELRDALLDPEAYLRGSPPIAPARSVAPGEAVVDAKTVMAHADALAAQKASAKTRMQAPAAEPWQVAPTIMQDGEAPAVAFVLPRTGALILPGLAQPAEPNHHTMRIATPVGYSSHPPRKMWPIVLVMGLMLGIVGGGFAVAWFGRGGSPASSEAVAATEPTDSAVTTTKPDAPTTTTVTPLDGAIATTQAIDASVAKVAVDAAPVVVNALPPDAGEPDPTPTKTAKLTIISNPARATVYGPDGKLLGKTKLEIDWPVSTETVMFELRLAGHRKKPKPIVVDGNTTISVEMEKLPRGNGGRGSGNGKGSAVGKGSAEAGQGSDNGLIRPGD